MEAMSHYHVVADGSCRVEVLHVGEEFCIGTVIISNLPDSDQTSAKYIRVQCL